MHLWMQASEEYAYGLDLAKIAKIWRGGCIISAHFLDAIYNAFQKKPNLPHLLLDSQIEIFIQESLPSICSIVTKATKKGIAISAYEASLNLFYTLRTENMSNNLIKT